MALPVGGKLGPYEILGLIGAGGMGEVYRARDPRMGRDVAIKVSAEQFSQRFGREVRAVAALNHPNICQIYDVGPNYLVMEFIEGETPKGPMLLNQVLALAGEILEALDAAHRRGITHRDLKPGNILLSKRGVKMLDFGLAKIEHAAAFSGSSRAETETLPLTKEGTVLGTLPYMSPEQIEGREADARSDIFSLGVMLYELISGKRPFTGNSQASLIGSILKERPRPLREWQPLTPPGVERVIETCLEKDPERRWQSAREVRHALEWITAETAIPITPARPRLWPVLAALVSFIALGLGGWILWHRPASGQTMRLAAPFPETETSHEYVSVSPDGRKLAFISAAGASNGLWVRDLSSVEWRHLPGTEGAASPFWSPDSRYVAFAAGTQLKKVDISGGPPQTLCTLQTRIEGSGAWNRDGVIIFGSWGGGAGGPLWKTSESGGEATALTEVDTSKGELYHTWPSFTEDGEHFLYFRSGATDVAGIYVGSLKAKPAEQSRERLLATQFAASYAAGALFFVRANTLLAQPLDIGNFRLQGEPVPLAESLATNWYGTGVFWPSAAGALAYETRTVSGSLQLTWLDRQGKVVSTVGEPGQSAEPRLSPDGLRAVVRDAPYGTQGDLWMVDLGSGRRTRFTFLQTDYSPGVWSPDGASLAFSGGSFGDTLYEKASSGVGEDMVLLKESGIRHYPTSWSHDGRFLLYHTENTPKTGYDLWVLPLQGNHKPVRLIGEAYNEWAGSFSPDMHWIAYASTEQGGGAYVRPFLATGPSGDPSLGQGKWQMSGGNWPKWIGREIIFDDVPRGTSQFSVQVNAHGDVFESGSPQRLFTGPLSAGIEDWDVSRDGQRFLWTVPQAQKTAQVPITVVLNWPALLKK